MAYMIFKTTIQKDEWNIPREYHNNWDYFYPQSSFNLAKQKVVNNFSIFYQLWKRDKYFVIPSINNGKIGKRMVTTITFNLFNRKTFSFKEFVEEWGEYRTRISPDARIKYEIVNLETVYMLGW